MSDAYEALMGMTDDQVTTYTIDPSTEGHIVVGPDRFVTVPESLKRIGVQYDHNIETVTFDCPRYWDDHDMSQMHIYINFRAANGEIGGYIAQNISVDGDIMHFDWTITKDVTQAAGNIAFLVCVKKSDVEGNEENHWNSELCMDMYVSEGLESEPTLEDYDPIVITQLLTRMDSVELINIQADEMQELYLKTEGYAANAYMNANLTKVMAEEAIEAFDFARSKFSNAIKYRVRGEGIRLNDISPVPMLDVEVAVRSRNLAVRTNTATTYTANGITFTVKNNGTVKATGTATGTAYYLLQTGTDYDAMIPIKRGHYSMPLAPAEGCRIVIGIRESSEAERSVDNSTLTYKCSFDVTNDTTRFDVILCVDSGYTVNDVIFEPLIVEGEDAGEYTAYVDPKTVVVMGYGKNILPTPDRYYDNSGDTIEGITYTVNEDGSIRAVGTATEYAGFRVTLMDLTGLTYTLTDCVYDPSDKGVYIWVNKGQTIDKVFYPQVELGSIATARENPKETIYANVSEDGTAVIKAIQPVMSLIPDKPGVILDVEYNVDINSMEFLQGPSAYDIAVKYGFDGSEEEWLASLSEAGASVKYVYQELTDEQKARARDNIGAASVEYVDEKIGSALPEVAESTKTSVLSKTDLEGFYYMTDYGMYGRAYSSMTINLSVGDSCTVVWDNTEWTCAVVDMSSIIPGALGLGNLSFANMGGNNEYFAIGFFADGGVTFLSTRDDVEGKTHTVEIYTGTPSSDEGKFLRVVGGEWTAVSIESAEGSSF